MFDQQNGVVNEALKSMGLLNEGPVLAEGWISRADCRDDYVHLEIYGVLYGAASGGNYQYFLGYL